MRAEDRRDRPEDGDGVQRDAAAHFPRRLGRREGAGCEAEGVPRATGRRRLGTKEPAQGVRGRRAHGVPRL